MPNAAVAQKASQGGTATSATETSVKSEDWFVDQTAQSGVNWQYSTGREAQRFTLLETLGGGAALFDFDRDGDLDLCLPGGGTISEKIGETGGTKLGWFRNQGRGTFERLGADFGPQSLPDYTHGCAVGDYDRDSFPDLLVTAYGTSRLLLNERGGRFREATVSAGIMTRSWDTAAVFVDLTGDGFPELYVATYVDLDTRAARPCPAADGQPDVCPPQAYQPLRDRLYWNLGDGTFVDVTEEAGLLHQGRGLGVLAVDVNQDGWSDLYVANDDDPNHLYLGGDGWPLKETGLAAGVATNDKGATEGSMGLDYSDINGDGHGDFWVTNFELEDHSIYLGDGQGQFEHATLRLGLGGSSRADVGFGTSLHDFDGDGWLDCYVMNGHVVYHGRGSFQQRPYLYRNQAGRRFEDVSARGGAYFRTPHVGRGTAVGDLNGDGALDLIISQLEEPVAILQNRQIPQAWVGAQLIPRGSEPSGIGTTVTLKSGQPEQLWIGRTGTSFASHSEPRVHFCLPQMATEASLEVRWSSGRTERFPALATNRVHALIEGTGQ